MIYILDTDHVSLFLQSNQAVVSRVALVALNLAVTIITVQEAFNGWVVKINARSESENLVRLYTQLWTTQEFFKGVRILNFDTTADNCYDRLLREYPQLNKKRILKDLRIASIALSVNAVMVTRNQKDFSQIPDLRLEDWTH